MILCGLLLRFVGQTSSRSGMKKLLYIFCVLLAPSCVKHSVENSPESRLEITARIAETADSKVIHEGRDFKDGNTIGVFVYHSET